MSKINFNLNDVLVCYYNETIIPITFKSFGLSERSLLSLYGYSVKSGGLNRLKRQKILNFIINNRIMSRVEVKSFLEYLINFNGRKSNMYDAIYKWESDIDYINKLIIFEKL